MSLFNFNKTPHGTIAELKKLIEKMDDNDLFVIPTLPHKYKIPKVYQSEVLAFGKNDLNKWTGDECDYGYENMQELEVKGGKVVKVIIIE